MIRTAGMIVMCMVLVVFSAQTVHAGVLGKVRSLVTGEVMAFFLTGIVAIIGGLTGMMFRKVTRTFKEVGEFLSVLGTALEDQRLTRDELAAIIKEGREVFCVWR